MKPMSEEAAAVRRLVLLSDEDDELNVQQEWDLTFHGMPESDDDELPSGAEFYEIWCGFDNSMTHKAKSPDGLDATKLKKSNGGANVEKQHQIS